MDGGSIAGTLFIVFLVLKLTHVITWSWVTAPLWIDAAATAALLLLVAVGAIGGFGIFKLADRHRKKTALTAGRRW